MQTETDMNGIPSTRARVETIEAKLVETRPAIAPRITMAACLGIFALAFAGVGEVHKLHLDAQAIKDRVDVTTASVRELTHAVNPKADHAICPAKDGRPEIDMGVPFECPNKDDGQCLKTPSGETLPVSVAGARCQAGKL
jgi:hypothetical protein